MEELMRELITVIKEANAFSWKDAMNVMAVVAPWVTIVFLLKERAENNRPYLQITFELVRSNLTCIVLRNTGNVPVNLKELHLDEKFIEQLPERERNGLKNNKINNMTIFPGRQWVICLGVIVPEILGKYKKKVLDIDYTYTQLNRKKKYKEQIQIDFEQFSRCLIYISEIDELREVNKKIAKEVGEVKKDIRKIHGVVVKYANLEDVFEKNLMAGYEKDSELGIDEIEE